VLRAAPTLVISQLDRTRRPKSGQATGRSHQEQIVHEITLAARNAPRCINLAHRASSRTCALATVTTQAAAAHGGTARSPVAFISFDLGRSAHEEVPPPVVAPLDEGRDAPELAQRILAGSLALAEVLLHAEIDGVELSWRGSFVSLAREGHRLRMHGPSAAVELDLGRVIAVSYCSSRTDSGIRLYGEEGTLLTLWCKDMQAFDLVLADAFRDSGQRT
jgi:hypothetical protein